MSNAFVAVTPPPSVAGAPPPGAVPLNPSLTRPAPVSPAPSGSPAPQEGDEKGTHHSQQQPRADDGKFQSAANGPDGKPIEQPGQAPATDASKGAEGEPAPVTDPATPEQTPEQKAEKERYKQSAAERINQITAKRREAETRASRAESENAELRKQLGELNKKLQADPGDQLSTARAAAKMERLETNTAEINAAQQTAHDATVQTFHTKLEIASKTGAMPGLDAAYNQFMSLPVNNHLAEELVAADSTAELVHYYGTNPDQWRTLLQMTPTQQTRAIAARAASIQNVTATVPKTTQAPSPIKPISGASAPNAFDPNSSSMEEYAARWDAENKQRAKRGW